MLIVKSFRIPVAQLAISVLDETTGYYFSDEMNQRWLNDTHVALDKLDILMPGGHLSGTIRQLTVEGHIEKESERFDMKLSMNPRGHPLLNLVTGMIPFSGGIDWEYALPRMETAGELNVRGKKYTVRGWSWLDREWGRFGPSKWTWMNIQLNNGVQISLWDEQTDDSNPASYVGGAGRFATILDPDGGLMVTAVRIEELDTWISQKKPNRTYAKKWRVTIPGRTNLMVNSLQDGQEIESKMGANRVESKSEVEGTYESKLVTGVTIVEMYDLFPLFQALGAQ
jgi:predicted secreted hydrolase